MQKNKIISQLSEYAQNKLRACANEISMTVYETICESGAPVEFVYFPISGYLSVIQELDERQSIEVGLVGCEGYLGGELVVGLKNNPFKVVVQGEGLAWRLGAQDFLKIIKENQEIKTTADRYCGFRLRQLGLSIACGHFHGIQARLAKWILMSQDRSESNEIVMTQEFISLMLGVRRVGISGIASEFRKKGLIDYTRGVLRVLNRVELERLACSCYEREKELHFQSLFHQVSRPIHDGEVL